MRAWLVRRQFCIEVFRRKAKRRKAIERVREPSAVTLRARRSPHQRRLIDALPAFDHRAFQAVRLHADILGEEARERSAAGGVCAIAITVAA
jgi:hypothetical protein